MDVQSSVIRRIGYDLDSRLLIVEFHNKAVYHYNDVPVREVIKLLEADSIGNYYNLHIRDYFSYTQAA